MGGVGGGVTVGQSRFPQYWRNRPPRTRILGWRSVRSGSHRWRAGSRMGWQRLQVGPQSPESPRGPPATRTARAFAGGARRAARGAVASRRATPLALREPTRGLPGRSSSGFPAARATALATREWGEPAPGPRRALACGYEEAPPAPPVCQCPPGSTSSLTRGRPSRTRGHARAISRTRGPSAARAGHQPHARAIVAEFLPALGCRCAGRIPFKVSVRVALWVSCAQARDDSEGPTSVCRALRAKGP